MDMGIPTGIVHRLHEDKGQTLTKGNLFALSLRVTHAQVIDGLPPRFRCLSTLSRSGPCCLAGTPSWPDWKNLHKLVQSFSDMSDVPEEFRKTIPILHGNHHLGGVTPPGQKRMTVYYIEI